MHESTPKHGCGGPNCCGGTHGAPPAAEEAGGMDRGDFLKVMAAIPLAGMAAAAFASAPAAPEPGEEAAAAPDEPRRKWGMAIDMDLCSGCGACVVACHVENNVPCTGDDPKLAGTEIDWMTMLPMASAGGGSDNGLFPVPCMHCENPPCVKVCPVNATYQNDEGIVDQIWDRCIGCRYCMNACPYSRRYFNWTEPSFPEAYRQALNPDVAPRPHGVVEKCTFCVHRVRRVKEDARADGRTVTDEDVQLLPACAQSCPTQAIIFGDLNDPGSLVSRMAASPRAYRLLEHAGTRPKVYFLGKNKSLGFDRKEG